MDEADIDEAATFNALSRKESLSFTSGIEENNNGLGYLGSRAFVDSIPEENLQRVEIQFKGMSVISTMSLPDNLKRQIMLAQVDMNIAVTVDKPLEAELHVSEFRFLLSQEQVVFIMRALTQNLGEAATFVTSAQISAPSPSPSPAPATRGPNDVERTVSSDRPPPPPPPGIHLSDTGVSMAYWRAAVSVLADLPVSISAKVRFDGIRLNIFEKDGGITATPSDQPEDAEPLSVAQLKFGSFGADFTQQANAQDDTLNKISAHLSSITIEDTRPDTSIDPKYRKALAMGGNNDANAFMAEINMASHKSTGNTFLDADVNFDGLQLIVQDHIIAMQAYATETMGMLPKAKDAPEVITNGQIL